LIVPPTTRRFTGSIRSIVALPGWVTQTAPSPYAISPAPSVMRFTILFEVGSITSTSLLRLAATQIAYATG